MAVDTARTGLIQKSYRRGIRGVPTLAETQNLGLTATSRAAQQRKPLRRWVREGQFSD